METNCDPKPVKVSLEDLGDFGSSAPVDTHGRELEFDLGNLLAFDPAPVDPEEYLENVEDTCIRVAQEITQSLVTRLNALPSRMEADGRVLELPEPSTKLPRQKPLPKPRELTKWEQFAQRKGIQKRKKDKLVWDESAGEWRRRFGYKRVNDPKDIQILPAKATDKPGEDPFTKMEEEKQARVMKQNDRQLQNVRASVKKGGHVPANVKLTSALPEHGKGNPLKRRGLESEISGASNTAGLSTASMGKFDRQVKGEKEGERAHVSKKRQLVSGGSEQNSMAKMADKMVREKSDKDLDVGRAVSKLEADRRKQRHSEKVQSAIEAGFDTKKGRKALFKKSQMKKKKKVQGGEVRKSKTKPGKFAAKRRGIK